MAFSGCAFFIAAINLVALGSPNSLARVACHSASVGLEDILFPSSLTEPMSIGTSFVSSGAASKNDLIVMMRPSTVGAEPTRGGAPGAGGPKKKPRKGGLIFSAAAVAAPFSLDHSIFCSEAMSLG